MQNQKIQINDNNVVLIEYIKYSEEFPTQVYLCDVDMRILGGRNFIKNTPLSKMIEWAENKVRNENKIN